VSHGCLPRSARSSHQSLSAKPPDFWRATNPGIRSACRWSSSASATGWSNFPLAWAMPTGSMVRPARAT
jgi:hypothetical protein